MRRERGGEMGRERGEREERERGGGGVHVLIYHFSHGKISHKSAPFYFSRCWLAHLNFFLGGGGETNRQHYPLTVLPYIS